MRGKSLTLTCIIIAALKTGRDFFPKKTLVTQKGILRRMESQWTPHSQENHYPQDN